MGPHSCDRFWSVDPAPVPPSGDPSTMAYWRLYSAWVLQWRP